MRALTMIHAQKMVKNVVGTDAEINGTLECGLADMRIFGKSVQNGTPTPEAPVAIESAEGSINSYERNIASIVDRVDTIVNHYYIDVPTSLVLQPSTKYTLSYNYNVISNDDMTKLYLTIGYGTNNFSKDIVSISPYPTYLSGTSGRIIMPFTTPISFLPYLGTLAIRFARSTVRATFIVAISKVQIEFGSTATPYTPYRAPTTIPLPILRGIPVVSAYTDPTYTDANGQAWVADEIRTVRDGLDWKVEQIQRIERHVLKGTEYMYFTSPTFYYTPSGVYEMKQHSKIYSNGYVSGYSPYVKDLSITSERGVFRSAWIRHDAFAGDVIAYKSYLSQLYDNGSPIYFDYILGAPIVADITNTALGQSVLSMRTHPGYTHLYAAPGDNGVTASFDAQLLCRRE